MDESDEKTGNLSKTPASFVVILIGVAYLDKEATMRKFIIKPVSVLLCFAFLLLAVPALNSAERKAPKSSLIVLINQPIQMLTSLFPALNAFFKSGSRGQESIPSSGTTVRPTGESSIGKPSGRD